MQGSSDKATPTFADELGAAFDWRLTLTAIGSSVNRGCSGGARCDATGLPGPCDETCHKHDKSGSRSECHIGCDCYKVLVLFIATIIATTAPAVKSLAVCLACVAYV
jgi:hypothetical protein